MKLAVCWRFFCALLSTACCLSFAGAARAAKSVDVTEIDFTHFTVGHVKLITNKDYFKIVSLNNHFELISKAPDWRVFSFNRNNRLLNETSPDTFLAFIAQMNDGWSLQFPPDTQTKNITYFGLPAQKRTLFVKNRTLGWTKTFLGYKYYEEEAITYTGDMVSKPCLRVVNELFDMHSSEGMYLALKFVSKKGGSDIRFACKNSVRKSVPKEFFNVPVGYKKGTIAQVLGNAQPNAQNVNSMIEDMGVGRSF